jgi:hypothetical protein
VSGTRRLLRAGGEDILPRAPDSALNAPIGPRRRLVGYHAARADLRAARAGGGGTPNDIGLTVVAGALRAVASRRDEPPRAPLKAMVPVSMRAFDEPGPGNRSAMVNIRLPVHLDTPHERLAWVPFNVTISQSPAPRAPISVLGCELEEVYSVVPVADHHALAIGMVRYDQELFFGCYGDPDALPELDQLPALLEAEMHALGSAARRPAPPAAVTY